MHTSNFEVRGFTSSVDADELAVLARKHGIPLAMDLGSGTLVDMRQWGLPHEPTARESLAAGADLIMFSGDKLLAGPSAACAGCELVDRLRRNPLKRAPRVDKLILAALDQVLRSICTPSAACHRRCRRCKRSRGASDIDTGRAPVGRRVRADLPQAYAVEVVECTSQIGSRRCRYTSCAALASASETGRRRDRDRDIQLPTGIARLPLPIIARTTNAGPKRPNPDHRTR